jgi:hypothetical protein
MIWTNSRIQGHKELQYAGTGQSQRLQTTPRSLQGSLLESYILPVEGSTMDCTEGRSKMDVSCKLRVHNFYKPLGNSCRIASPIPQVSL